MLWKPLNNVITFMTTIISNKPNKFIYLKKTPNNYFAPNKMYMPHKSKYLFGFKYFFFFFLVEVVNAFLTTNGQIKRTDCKDSL